MSDGKILGQLRGVRVTTFDGYGRRQVRAILAGLLLATFVASLDQTVVAAAMYRIGESLNGLTAQAWVTTAFLITSTISVPVFGKLSDTHGRRRMFVVAIAVFLAGSALCALASSMVMLAAFRACQGVGAGGIMTLTSAVLGDVVAPRERAKYGGWFVAVYAVASVVGPVTGGALAGQRTLLGVDGWRWIFLLNLPVGVAACVVVTRVLRPGVAGAPRRRRRLDVLGTLTLIAAAVPLLLVASRGQAWGWGGASAVCCYAIGAAGVVGFLLAERRAGDGALLTLRLFRNHGFAVGAGQSLVVNLGMFGVIALLPLYLQLVRGYSPTAAGLLLLPQVAGTLAGSVIAGQFTSRTGRYKLLPVIGSVLLLSGMLLLSRLSAGTPLAYAEAVMVLIGAGSTLYAQTITLSMQNALPQADLGVATSSNTFFRQIGATAGAAVFLSITYGAAGRAIRAGYASVAAPHPGQAEALRLAASGSQAALNDPAFLARLSPVLAWPFRAGFASALDVAFLAAAVVMVAALALALMIRELPLRTTLTTATPAATPAAAPAPSSAVSGAEAPAAPAAGAPARPVQES
jgi:EmrB/QacA subfamily drug resistance transporter